MPDEYDAMNESDYPTIDDYGDGGYGYDYGDRWGGGRHHQRLPDDLQSIAPLDTEATWFKRYWRPAIGWQYLIVCLFDFIFAPCIVVFFYYTTGQEYHQWTPLTLAGGGLYHLAMGAIIGVTSYGRSQEKLRGIES